MLAAIYKVAIIVSERATSRGIALAHAVGFVEKALAVTLGTALADWDAVHTWAAAVVAEGPLDLDRFRFYKPVRPWGATWSL